VDRDDGRARARRPWHWGILLTWYATAFIFLGGGVVVLVKAIVSGFPSRWIAAGVLLLVGLLVLIGTIIEHRRGMPSRGARTRFPSFR